MGALPGAHPTMLPSSIAICQSVRASTGRPDLIRARRSPALPLRAFLDPRCRLPVLAPDLDLALVRRRSQHHLHLIGRTLVEVLDDVAVVRDNAEHAGLLAVARDPYQTTEHREGGVGRHGRRRGPRAP